MLQQMEGAAKSDRPVIVLAATNLPERMEKAILDRFTTQIEIPLPDEPARAEILKRLLAERPCDPALDVEETCAFLAKRLNRKSGRDLVMIVNRAMERAATESDSPETIALTRDLLLKEALPQAQGSLRGGARGDLVEDHPEAVREAGSARQDPHVQPRRQGRPEGVAALRPAGHRQDGDRAAHCRFGQLLLHVAQGARPQGGLRRPKRRARAGHLAEGPCPRTLCHIHRRVRGSVRAPRRRRIPMVPPRSSCRRSWRSGMGSARRISACGSWVRPTARTSSMMRSHQGSAGRSRSDCPRRPSGCRFCGSRC